jgi:PAS domain S-box-containing protein
MCSPTPCFRITGCLLDAGASILAGLTAVLLFLLLHREPAGGAPRGRLAESEMRLQATFEQASIGIAHVALDGRFLRVNAELCAMSGYTADELLSRRSDDITHPDDVADDVRTANALLAGDIQTRTKEKRYLRKDGATVWATSTSRWCAPRRRAGLLRRQHRRDHQAQAGGNRARTRAPVHPRRAALHLRRGLVCDEAAPSRCSTAPSPSFTASKTAARYSRPTRRRPPTTPASRTSCRHRPREPAAHPGVARRKGAERRDDDRA